MSNPLFVILVLLTQISRPELLHAQDTTQKITPNRVNAPQQQDKPYVILISADGFRYDYIEKYQAQHLSQLGQSGVRAKAMIPSFPSITFPNHYTLVTGLYPAHHGLVGNNMYDPKTHARYSLGNAKEVKNPYWYGGTPIWTLAEQQGLLSASFYWPGSEAPIQGALPSYYYPYNEKIPIHQRIQSVVNWLSLPIEKRPHFIAFYFPEVDHAGHQYGPSAPETAAAVHFVDSAVYALQQAIAKTKLPVNFVLVSDHGMTSINRDEPLALPIQIDTSQMTVVSNGSLVSVFVKDSTRISSLYQEIRKRKKEKQFEVYLKEDLPKRFHYGGQDDHFNRVGDLILLAQAPYYFSNNRPSPGAHGYDPKVTPEMKASFLAWGPAFKQGLTIAPFENVEVYPLLIRILGLTSPRDPVDGKGTLAKEILMR